MNDEIILLKNFLLSLNSGIYLFFLQCNSSR